MSDYRVSTKLTEEEYKQIEKLIGEGKYIDVCDFVCVAVRKLVKEETGGSNQEILEAIRKAFRTKLG